MTVVEDLATTDRLEDLFAGADAVIHLAHECIAYRRSRALPPASACAMCK